MFSPLDLPYADSTGLSVKDLSYARWLVAEELCKNSPNAWMEAQSESVKQQHRLHEDLHSFLESMSALRPTSSPVVLSPTSTTQDSVQSTFSSSSSLFAPIAKPRIHKNWKRTRVEDEENAADPNGSDDGLYFETLLSQSLHANLFLQHANIEQEGDLFLQSMQRTQESLWQQTQLLHDLNAVRCLEQLEFASALAARTRLNDGLGEKVSELRKVCSDITCGHRSGPGYSILQTL